MKPRVLFVDHAGVLGGAELYLLDVVSRLKSTGHVLLFERGPFEERLKAEAIPTTVLPAPDAVMGVDRSGGRMNDVKAIPGIMKMVLAVRRMAREYDVVYANSQKALIVGALAGRMARRPVIWNLHDIMTADHFSGGHRKVAVAFANRFVDRVIVNSEATREAFVACGGDGAKTSIVYNGIASEPFDSVSAQAVTDLRAGLGLEGRVVVGLFSRLTPWKGQHVLIDAIARLPGVHAMLVGGALFQDDASYERELREQVSRLGVEDRVHFLGFRDDVPRLMKAADIVVHCSTAPEPFGRVIVEGMLAGKPVVAARAGGALEIVRDGETGLLADPGDAEDLAASLHRLIQDPLHMQRIAEAGLASATQRFSIEQIVLQIEQEIRNVVGDPHVLKHTETSVTPV